MKLPVFLPTVALFGCSLAAHAEPQWIWLDKKATDGQQLTFRKTFDLAGEVKSATLQFSVDDAGRAKLNGKPSLETPAWQTPAKGDVKALLKPGANELVIDGKNHGSLGAAVATLQIELADGKKVTIETGSDWEVAPAGQQTFKPAVVIAKYGDRPWGEVFSGKRVAKADSGPQTVIDPKDIGVPPGFKVELLYTVPKAEQGSWVSMTVDPKGRIVAGDQYGGLYRVDVTTSPVKVEPISTPADTNGKPLGGAHGLLYAFNSLYLMNNEGGGKGLWRLPDPSGDEKFTTAEKLRTLQGGGEHGPHSIVLSPDGKSLFFCDGNHTKLPDNMELSRAAQVWQEDHIIARLWDGNGHARGILAPGGAVFKTDPEGKTVELYSYGFRNEFDIAFDANGELFTYDSDMEWDIGAPWYRPTRIAHATSGSDNGWRSGAGKWPSYYPDSVPQVLDIGPGSPTGVVFGTGAKFPAKYQRAFFANDWTYGTMYAIHLTPDGAGFKAEKEEFVTGKPLPLTDVIIHPKDGAMYFAIGGRKTQSGLYRVSYVGSESTAPAPKYIETPEAKLRHELEQLHVAGTGPDAVEKAWPHLASSDRHVRFAARVAIERQPVAKWAERALAEKDPQAAIEALIALSRVGRSTGAAEAALEAGKKLNLSSGPVHATLPEDAALQKRVLEALGRLDFARLDRDQRLALLRAYQLCFTRFGKPGADALALARQEIEPLFPSKDPLENRELVATLVFLDSPTIVAKTVPLLVTVKDATEDIANESLLARNEGYARAAQAMQASRPNGQAISCAYALRTATVGWTPALRKTFFSWFPSTRAWKGGNSFNKFLENIRTEALVNFVPETERATLDELSKKAAPAAVQNVVMPKGPGRAYTVDDIVALTKDGLHSRNFEDGKAMFSATLCASCHHFAGDGGNIGPDLTGAGNRYTMRDLAENIVDPSKVISDQYGSEQIELKDGNVVIGRPVVEENGKLFVMTNPLAPNDLTPVDETKIKTRHPWNVSMMPPGLISSLNEDELKDLLAYLLSGGNANDKAFAK